MLVTVNSVTTDHIIIRGYYFCLSMCIYGEIKEDPNKIMLELPFFNNKLNIRYLENDLKNMNINQKLFEEKLKLV